MYGGAKRKSRKSRKSRSSRKSKKVYLPHPRPGALTATDKRGKSRYSTKDTADRRRKVLTRDVKRIGYKTTILDLNLIATLNKNQNPETTRKIRDDMEYLRKKYRSSSRKSHSSRKSRTSRRKSRR